MLRREANATNELQISIKEMALRLGNERSDMMVGSSLHVLDREGYIDRFDIPGKRVRGTRVLQPEVRGHQLKLDAVKLREKERRDRAKLRMMIDFAYARECRQQAILRYFGEPDPARCGNCDICLETAGPARSPTEEEALIVRKALSGVARMSAKMNGEWQPRFGRGRIVQTLVGSRSQEIIQARLDQLSTHGLLKSEGVAYLNQLMRELQDAGMLVSSGGQYPMVTLTRRGDEVMKGGTGYQLRWPQRNSAEHSATRRPKEKKQSIEEMLPVDAAILERLKRLRLDLAREQGNLPAYIVFPDETLRAFARLKPASIEAGRKIRGVGEVKARKYLPAFIEEIRSSKSETRNKSE
jgi:ATP-dependent DNA helicase RecQ